MHCLRGSDSSGVGSSNIPYSSTDTIFTSSLWMCTCMVLLQDHTHFFGKHCYEAPGTVVSSRCLRTWG